MNALFHAGGQWAVFVWFAIAGVLAGVLRDAIFAFSRPLEGGTALKIAFGVLAGAGAAVIAAVAYWVSASDAPRVYMLAALLLGALLYRITLGAMVRSALRLLQRIIARLAAIWTNSAICRRIFQ